MVYLTSYSKPISITIYGKTIEYKIFHPHKNDKSLKDFEVKDITPYHFLVYVDYYQKIYTIEQDDWLPHYKTLHRNLISELFEYFKDIIPKKRLITYLFYLDGCKENFPLFDPDIIDIQKFNFIDLDLIKKYKSFNYDEILYILSNCNLEICEYLEKQFQITNLPTKKKQANEFIEKFIKLKYISGVQIIATKFKIDTSKIISKSISTKSFDTLVIMYSSISKVQREKYYDQLIKLMPKLIGCSSLTVDFLKLIEDIKPIAWNEYTYEPTEGFNNYQLNQKSILGFVTYHTPLEIIDYIAEKLKPKLITDTYYSHSRYYTVYTLYIHVWDRKDTQSINVLKKLVDIYQKALTESGENESESGSEESESEPEEEYYSSDDSDD